jgi:hypothetical protein
MLRKIKIMNEGQGRWWDLLACIQPKFLSWLGNRQGVLRCYHRSPQSRRGEPKQKGPEYDEQEASRLCQVCQGDDEIRTGVICMSYPAGSSTDVLGLDDRPIASKCQV